MTVFKICTWHFLCKYFKETVQSGPVLIHDLSTSLLKWWSGAETAYPSRASEVTPAFSWVRVALSFVFCVVFCI